MPKVRNISKLLLITIFAIFFKNPTMGQFVMDTNDYGLSTQKDTVIVKNGQFAFNTFIINNPSTRNIELGIKFILPSGWGFVSTPLASIKVNKGEFQSIPFRIAPAKTALGDINYPINILTKDPVSGKELSKVFFVKIIQNNKWSAVLLKPNLIIGPKDSLSKFEIKIKNNGNKRELFELEFKSKLRLSVPSVGTQVLLWPGKDTTLSVYVASKYQTAEVTAVSTFIKSKNETLMLVTDVFFTSDTYARHQSKYDYFPIDIQYVGVNDFDKSTGYRYFEAQGTYKLSKNSLLEFRARSNSLSSDFTINSHIYYLQYSNQRMEVSLGTLMDFQNYQINGYGSKFKFKTADRKEYSVFALKSRDIDEEIIGFNQNNYKRENKQLSSEALFIKNNAIELRSLYAIHKYAIKNNRNSFSVNLGYSSEKNYKLPNSSFGYMGGYNFIFKNKWFGIMTTYQHFDTKFSGNSKGSIYGNHEISYINKKSAFSIYSASNSRNAIVPFNSLDDPMQERLNPLLFSYIDNGLRYSRSSVYNKISFSFANFSQQQGSLNDSKMIGYKANIGYSKTTFKINHSLMVNFLNSRLNIFGPEQNKKAINTYYQLKYKSFGLNASYAQGPIFFYDLINNIDNKSKIESHNVALFYEFKNKSNSFYDRMNLSATRNSIIDRNNIYLRNEVYFELPKLKSSISIFSNLNILQPKLSPSWTITLKKTLQIPMMFKQKYFSASIFMFKDKNNNDLFDKGEEPISNVNIQINEQTLSSNKKGMVFLKNLPEDNYVIDFRKVQNLKGWVSKSGLRDTLVLNKNLAIGIPFKQSKMVSGIVSIENDKTNSENQESVGGILILAINKKGEIFKTSTNEKGEFYFNLSDDIYNIQIPTNIFGENYTIERSIFSVDLLKNQLSEIEFKIIQKRRRINIKKN